MKRRNLKKERLEVCYATHRFHPDYSGAAIRFQRYAPGLRQRGIELRVFTGTPQKQTELRDPLWSNSNPGTLLPLEHIDGLPVQRVSLPEGNTGKRQNTYIPALIQYCRQPETRPDLLQTTSVSIYWLPWWNTLRRLGIPIVHSYTLLGELSTNPVKRQLQRIYWRLPLEIADRIVVSSSIVRDALRKNLDVRTRIEIIPNGVDLQRFKPESNGQVKNYICDQYDINRGEKLILFVGPIIERKGIDRLLAAWKIIARELPRSHLLIVGPDFRNVRPHPYPDFAWKVRNLLRESNAENRVTFTGRVRDVERFFQAADLFVFPSRREGMGNVVLEAFSCGLASILTPFIGFPEEFGYPDKQFLLVKPNPSDLADSAIALLKNPKRRRTIGSQARKWVEKNLGVEKSLDKYARLYRELIACSVL